MMAMGLNAPRLKLPSSAGNAGLVMGGPFGHPARPGVGRSLPWDRDDTAREDDSKA